MASSSNEQPGQPHGLGPFVPGLLRPAGNYVLRWVHTGQDGGGYYERTWVPDPIAAAAASRAMEYSDDEGHDSDLPGSTSDSDDSESGSPVGQTNGMRQNGG